MDSWLRYLQVVHSFGLPNASRRYSDFLEPYIVSLIVRSTEMLLIRHLSGIAWFRFKPRVVWTAATVARLHMLGEVSSLALGHLYTQSGALMW